jgi:hypothetical protein
VTDREGVTTTAEVANVAVAAAAEMGPVVAPAWLLLRRLRLLRVLDGKACRQKLRGSMRLDWGQELMKMASTLAQLQSKHGALRQQLHRTVRPRKNHGGDLLVPLPYLNELQKAIRKYSLVQRYPH